LGAVVGPAGEDARRTPGRPRLGGVRQATLLPGDGAPEAAGGLRRGGSPLGVYRRGLRRRRGRLSPAESLPPPGEGGGVPPATGDRGPAAMAGFHRRSPAPLGEPAPPPGRPVHPALRAARGSLDRGGRERVL